MRGGTFSTVQYTLDTFQELLISYSDAAPGLIDEKLKSGYFRDYFRQIGVKTIVAEKHYVDHDYLEDFAAYYVKCFTSYKRTCARLHFFTTEFDQEEFRAFLMGESTLTTKTLEKSYAGFLVIRPLPASVIGRTCLKPYGPDSGRRHFPTVSRHSANLFGHPLSVQTVPFQEQDQVTAACATSALWSAFQVTGRRFQHRIPSPVEITHSATQQMPLRSRAFPTDGLTVEQMAHAIRAVGLEPYYVACAEEGPLRWAARAYLAAGIPPLLVFALEEHANGGVTTIGFHAATITGYSAPKTVTGATGITSRFLHNKVDKFYVHDDQVGPMRAWSSLILDKRTGT